MPEIKIACYVNDVLVWRPFSGNSVKTGSTYTLMKDNDMIFHDGRWWPFNAEMLMWFVDIFVEPSPERTYTQVELSGSVNLLNITSDTFGGGIDSNIDPQINFTDIVIEKYYQSNSSIFFNTKTPISMTAPGRQISNCGTSMINGLYSHIKDVPYKYKHDTNGMFYLVRWVNNDVGSNPDISEPYSQWAITTEMDWNMYKDAYYVTKYLPVDSETVVPENSSWGLDSRDHQLFGNHQLGKQPYPSVELGPAAG